VFADTLAEMLERETLGYFVTFKYPYQDDEWSDETIISVVSHTNIEEGKHPKGRRIGSHSLIEITHCSKIHLNYKEMTDFMNFALAPYGVKGVYVHGAMAGDGFKNLLSYMRKDEEALDDITQEEFLEAATYQVYDDSILKPRE